MPVPWEALLPFGACLSEVHHIQLTQSTVGLVTVMFGAAGTLFNVSTRAQNLGKVRCAPSFHVMKLSQGGLSPIAWAIRC